MMNVDNNSDPNEESLEAPEDDDFGDFEAPEDEAPEAVQAMIGGPNWVYPDLVRIQSSSNSNIQSDSNDSRLNLSGFNNNNNRIPHRILDPPDVSLLTSSLNSSKPQNTLDLCSSLGTNGPKLIFNSGNHSAKGCMTSGPASISSPSSGSSSSSMAATNISGLILSNSSNSSSPSLSNNKNDNFQATMNICNNLNAIASTSNGITSGMNHHMSQMEQKIRSLEVEKRLLQEQLCERDKQINDLQRMASGSGFSGDNKVLDESIGRRIENTLERIESNLETSITSLTNRVERLENKVNVPIAMNGGIVNHSDSNSNHVSNDGFLQIKSELQQERRETLRILSNILSHALQEINSLN